jgi:cell division topological specificity factor
MAFNLLQRLLGIGDKGTKGIAKDRLRFVLLHDRATIPAPVMEKMRQEIMEVLSKYVEIDETALDVSVERVDDSVALIANIPIKRVHIN